VLLLGREFERQTLDRLLADARLGRSGVLALVGEPGIGKTALLDQAAANADGMRVLRARGVESEAEVPFGGLLELLRPALGAVDQIPGPQAEALSGALALRPAKAGDRFAIGAATLSLLAAFAEHEPLLVLIDDAHSLDPSSSETLRFAFRRLLADPIAVLIAARSGEPSLLDGSDLPQLELGGLDRKAAARLAASSAPEGALASAADRLYEETGGNPLALVELAADTSWLGHASPEAPLPISASIAQAFLRRSGSLPDETRSMLVLAAASDDGDLATLGRAAASLGLGVEALAAAEDAGLVVLGPGSVEFRHPLVRSAVYGEADADERRAAHRALAGALPDRKLDQRAWHLASAAIGPDAAASAALEAAGVRARERSAYSVAASAFERGARLATDAAAQPDLLHKAADSALNAGLGERAAALLDEAHAADPLEPFASRIDHLRGYLLSRRGRVMEGHAMLVAAAERAARDDPELAIVMLAEASLASFYCGAAGQMLRTAERANELLTEGVGVRPRFFAYSSLGAAQVVAGDGEAGAAVLRAAAEILDASEELREDPRLLMWAAVGPLWLREESEEARARVDRALAYARERSGAGTLPGLLHMIARVQAMSDAWPAAQAGYHEALRLSRESGQQTEEAAALAGLAWLEARQGAEEQCRLHAGAGRALCSEFGLGLYEVWSVIALGELDLGLGRPEAAIEHFEAQQRLLDELGILDVDLSPVPELVDAYLRLGRAADASVLVGPFVAAAEAKGQPWAMARAARCLGLVGSRAELDDRFGEALALHERTPDVFETARTRLAYGSRLRRERQRVRAREELRAALELFDCLGPTRWADLAQAELAATGETARRRDPSTLDDLTPQELQVGLLLAEGRTTRQAAAALFLSPKTVEYHLRNVYRKLGIASRDELARAIGARPGPARLNPN
jgi:DNA-binding CsgD family transcriptional regulator